MCVDAAFTSSNELFYVYQQPAKQYRLMIDPASVRAGVPGPMLFWPPYPRPPRPTPGAAPGLPGLPGLVESEASTYSQTPSFAIFFSFFHPCPCSEICSSKRKKSITQVSCERRRIRATYTQFDKVSYNKFTLSCYVITCATALFCSRLPELHVRSIRMEGEHPSRQLADQNAQTAPKTSAWRSIEGALKTIRTLGVIGKIVKTNTCSEDRWIL